MPGSNPVEHGCLFPWQQGNHPTDFPLRKSHRRVCRSLIVVVPPTIMSFLIHFKILDAFSSSLDRITRRAFDLPREFKRKLSTLQSCLLWLDHLVIEVLTYGANVAQFIILFCLWAASHVGKMCMPSWEILFEKCSSGLWGLFEPC